MRDWRPLRELYRPGRGEMIDLGLFYRGSYYRDHPRAAGVSEALYRMRALQHMAAMLPCVVHDDDELAGEPTFLLHALPAGISDDDYQQARAAHAAHPNRDFQRGGSHLVIDFPEVLAAGFAGYRQRVDAERRRERPASEKAYLEAMLAGLDAIEVFFRRHASAARAAGRSDLADRVDWLSTKPPRDMHDALQLIWLLFLFLRTEGRGANGFGRIDQYLWPFYDANRRDETFALFCHLWTKIESLHQSPNNQSSVTNIAIGGLTPSGENAENELSYIALEATSTVRSPSTNLSARFHDGSSERYHRACARCIMSGIGFPAIFNDEVNVPSLHELGIPLAAARDYCLVGCIESHIPGCQTGWSDGFSSNTMQCLERSWQRLPRSYDELWDNFRDEVERSIQTAVDQYNQQLADQPPERVPDVILSLFTRDCIARGLDVNAGGALYPRWHGLGIRGFASMVDSLAAIKKVVFEDGLLSIEQLQEILAKDFAGYENERQLLLRRAPKFGNDNPYVDGIARDVAGLYCRIVLAHHTIDGGRFLPLIASNIHNISAGREVGASPDGRFAHTPLSTACSPFFGNDVSGPTAFFASVAAPDFTLSKGGTVVNARFDPDAFAGADGLDRMVVFTKAFVRRRIQEMQFNFNNNAELEDALQHPREHENLVVRVSGFSAYFVYLDPMVQRDVIRRHAHGHA
ncbi:pyruvate formate lyase family protein [Oligosphaera ethanolica]|uniref:Formate C-acetyltransferase n=1 Tax=Oligosphaera ethanolica TaxID=760260 RepID=A0AAE3VFV3_9BACT|nr:pyruvate formate lyase family protein [Oligosphaera ethanolica]MDQ0289521.1 formate C-acetyltransferase [Oligosphaera ethanolica]